MSFLLLKAPDCDPRKAIHSAPHEEVIGLKKVPEGGSFWSVLRHTRDPVCTLHGEGQILLKPITSTLIEPEAGLSKFDNEQQQAKRQSETCQVRPERACGEEQEGLKQCLEDGSVCSFRECSTVCLHHVEEELKELSLQDGKVDASVSCLEGEGLKFVQPSASLEGSSLVLEEQCEGPLLSPGSGEVVSSSIKSGVGPIKFKSSLRGGHEKAGLGPRPKLQVTWDPDVYDPPCTSSSHTINQSHRRHHHPRSEHRSRHKGKGSSHSDSRKKSQKKIPRKSKHCSENFSSGPALVSPRGILSNTLMFKEYTAPLEDLTWKAAKVSPFILPPKGCFLNPVLPFGERDQLTFEKIEGCRLRHVQAHELCL